MTAVESPTPADSMRSAEPAGRISVLLLLPGYLPGGLERNALRLANWLRQRGHSVHVAALLDGGPMSDEFGAHAVPVHEIGFSGFVTPRIISTVGRVRRLLRREGIQLVHAYNQGPSLLASMACIGVDVPLVSSRRSLSYNAGIPGWAKRWVHRRAAATLVVSSAVEAEVRTEPGVAAERVHLIRTGVELPAIDVNRRTSVRDELGIGPRDVLLAWVGTLRAVKNPALLVRAFPGDVPRLSAAVVGDGPLRGATERLSVEAGLAGRLRFLGHRADVGMLLGAADVFVSTSDSEGLPTAVLEAMAHGLPVVATDAGGTADLVQDGVTGLLAPVGNASALSRHLRAVANDAELRRRFGAAARARVAKAFTVPAMVSQVERTYEAALGAAHDRAVSR